MSNSTSSCGCGYCRHGPLNRTRCLACMKLKLAKSYGVPKGSPAFSRMMRATREPSLPAEPSNTCQRISARDPQNSSLYRGRKVSSASYNPEAIYSPFREQPPTRASYADPHAKYSTWTGSTTSNSWRCSSDSNSSKRTALSKSYIKPAIMRGWQMD